MVKSWSSWCTHLLPRRSDFQKKCLARAILDRAGSSSPMIWVCHWSGAECTSTQRTSAQEWRLLCRASWAAPSGSVGHRCSKWHFAPGWILGHLGFRAWPNGLQSVWGRQSVLCSWAPQLLAYFSWMRSEASPTKIQLQQHLPNVSCPCATRTRYSSSEINWWSLGSCSYWSQLFWWIKSLAGWGSEPTCFHLSLQKVFSLRTVIFLLACTRRTARL